MQKISIHDEKKVKELLESKWEKAFRYSQIENAIYKNFITDFDEMTTLSKQIREILKENCFFSSLTLDHKIDSDNLRVYWVSYNETLNLKEYPLHLLSGMMPNGLQLLCNLKTLIFKKSDKLWDNGANILCCKNDEWWRI